MRELIEQWASEHGVVVIFVEQDGVQGVLMLCEDFADALDRMNQQGEQDD